MRIEVVGTQGMEAESAHRHEEGTLAAARKVELRAFACAADSELGKPADTLLGSSGRDG